MCLPCSENEHVFLQSPSNEPHFTYVYKTFFEQIGITISFTPFECEVLRIMNVAPTQLHPNSWAFLKAFQILCGRIGMEATAPKFLFFYKVRFGDRVDWISLSGVEKRGIVRLYKSSYKFFKSDFFKVRLTEGNESFFFDSAGIPKFPFYWQPHPSKFSSFDIGCTTAQERADVELLSLYPQSLPCGKLLLLPTSSTR